MITALFLYILVICVGIVAYFSLDKKVDTVTALICSALLFVFLLFFAIFRDGSVLPDYKAYVKLFENPHRNMHVEESFYLLRSLVKFLSPSDNVLYLFAVYAALGIGIKFYAIKKYSPYALFSIVAWLSSFYLLEDLIQMRASVAGALLLLFIPCVAQKKWLGTVLIFLMAYCFHNSAIIFLPILFLNPARINRNFWIIGYGIAFLVNVLNIDFYEILNYVIKVIPTPFVSDRLSAYFIREYQVAGGRLSMYAPYTLSLTLVCFYLLFHIDRIRETSPFSIIWLKVAFMSLYVYSLSIPGVTVRLSELLSIVHVFLIPLLVDAVPSKYRMCGGVCHNLRNPNLDKFYILSTFYRNHIKFKY